MIDCRKQAAAVLIVLVQRSRGKSSFPRLDEAEDLQGMSYHGAASDIWSCSVILFAVLTGRLPFDDENIRVLLQKVKNGRFTIPADLPADAEDLITRMLVVDPERRISVS